MALEESARMGWRCCPSTVAREHCRPDGPLDAPDVLIATVLFIIICNRNFENDLGLVSFELGEDEKSK
jgi:hypothetical protein